MQIRMIFGTILPPPEGEKDPIDLKTNSVVTVEDDLGQSLVADGRAEVYPAPAATPAAPAKDAK